MAMKFTAQQFVVGFSLPLTLSPYFRRCKKSISPCTFGSAFLQLCRHISDDVRLPGLEQSKSKIGRISNVERTLHLFAELHKEMGFEQFTAIWSQYASINILVGSA